MRFYPDEYCIYQSAHIYHSVTSKHPYNGVLRSTMRELEGVKGFILPERVGCDPHPIREEHIRSVDFVLALILRSR